MLLLCVSWYYCPYCLFVYSVYIERKKHNSLPNSLYANTSLANNADSHFDSEYVFTKYNLMSWYWLYARSLLHMIQSSTHHFSVCILAEMNQDVCVCDCMCFCICVNEFELVVCRFQPLMTFACCCCEQSDPAVLIKTNGTDHSPLIVFHWQMAPLTPEDCCRDPACLKHTHFTNEKCLSASICVCLCVCVCARERVREWEAM